ncbi:MULTISPECIES: indolepyruvate ferredoxin oxidoreductase subunit alpha [unclassified Endozoicomonas]|uniref:indolepyruvate ferredoxin oxidoreductase subunit alpha n=1 Tax=unclassified Endozoicomonas TaxID=2644528 RepID=UPI003BB60DDF
MTYVVKKDCVHCRFTDCVDVCPVEAFHQAPTFLVINPEVCIDCGVCEPECPIDAIKADSDLSDDEIECLGWNLEQSTILPVIAESQEPLV